MAKNTKRRIPMTPVNLWMSYVCECPGCHDAVLIREDPRKGDEMTCPNCEQIRLQVGDICGEHRKETGKRELNPTALGSL